MAKVDIFPLSSSTLGEGGGRVTVCLFGNANCWFTVDFICQHLADSASTSCVSCTVSNWSSDDALASPMTDSLRLKRGVVGCVVTQLSDDGVYRCLHGATLSIRMHHTEYHIQCPIDMIDIIIFIIMHGVSFYYILCTICNVKHV